jgi:hypothetical protein
VIRLIRDYAIPAALSTLPPAMASRDAAALLLAIARQESDGECRVQVGGPARGYWMFEQGGGVRGVLSHPKTADLARTVWRALDYPNVPTTWAVYDALRHNDVLAAAFARLLLWTLPDALPGQADPDTGWRLYVSAWRPGKPRQERWAESWRIGWGG